MTSIFIGNLPFEASEREVRTAFERYGRVSSVRMVTDRGTGRSKGCAFVSMSRLDDADEAIRRLNGSTIGGRRVTVNEARSSSPPPPHVASGRSESARPIAPIKDPIPWDRF
ncbi:RNA recognition motif domain-containing protein [Planctomyces sp. SH-PL14]|uniref:RNA recognition motif domain-containing protein n=1 Tax=Planctomyces sp. SH-PL14 TaxID=1632864 RepID=UPI00078C4A9B|nr:RNA-binding protein [Planctomyces sp. SH-PL14]AMV19689.1 RNA recognition motif protein [Planctomyces sp. SH-PL14]